MQTIINKYSRIVFYALFVLTIGAGMLFTSCDKDDDKKSDEVELLSFGPMPIARGGELRFIGNNLDRVTAIVLPDNIVIEASQFTKRSATLLALTVPQNAVEGLVVLKTPKGDITTKTRIGYSEPISIETFLPGVIKPGNVLTITGDYLNLVGEVIFTDRISVDSTNFISQSREEIKLLVPFEAQTGIIAVSDGKEDPIIIYSENELIVTVPMVLSVSPNPVKAGTNLTITGENFDLATYVIMDALGDEKPIAKANFVSQSATEIVVKVPDDNKDGKVAVIAASFQGTITTAVLNMVVPTEVAVAPTTIKNGQSITISGKDVDLVSAVIFGGGAEGVITSSSATQLVVNTPDNAVTGDVRLHTRAGKEIAAGNVTFVSPVITSFTPLELKPNNNLTITGQNMDLVEEVIFTGEMKGSIVSATETQMVVTVPVGAKTGTFTLVARNGVQVVSGSQVTILSNLPDVTGFLQARAEPGKILTIQGTNLLLIKELVFPGNVYATAYGLKTDTQVEVYVPTSVPVGNGTIRLITYEGEEGVLPTIFFGSVDPIYNVNLVFFDFNGTGKDSWWGNAMGSNIETNPATSADGTPYWRINGMSGTGWWDGLFFRNGNNNYSAAGVNVATWAVRFDLNTFEAFPADGNLKVRLGGGGDTHFYDFNLNNSMGFSNTNGWITVTLPLSGFKHESTGAPIPDAALGGSEFGMIWSSGVSVKVNLGIDNVRFEPIP